MRPVLSSRGQLLLGLAQTLLSPGTQVEEEHKHLRAGAAVLYVSPSLMVRLDSRSCEQVSLDRSKFPPGSRVKHIPLVCLHHPCE